MKIVLEADKDLTISSTDMRDLMQLMAENANIQFYDTKLNPISINDYIVNEFADGTYHVSIKSMSSLSEANNNSGLRKEYKDKVGKNKPDPNNPGYWQFSRYTRDDMQQQQSDDDADERYEEHKQDREWTNKERQWKEEDREEAKKDKQRRDDEHKHDREYEAKIRHRNDGEHREDRRWTKKEREWRSQDRANAARRDSEEARARSSSGKNVGILRDQDIKKMNDAAPALLVVKFYHSYKDENGNTVVSNVPTEFIIGVKSHLIPVTTSEILRRIMNDNKDGKKFMTFMRAITGELKASEIILGMSRIKDDVKSCKVKGAYGDTWKLLSNRAAAAREQIKQGKRNDFSAITTVLISQADADELFHEENIDISDPKNAMHFMRSYNLMGFVIADDATEVLKIMLDNGSGMFEERAYSMLERDNQDGKYKKLISLMASNK